MNVDNACLKHGDGMQIMCIAISYLSILVLYMWLVVNTKQSLIFGAVIFVLLCI